MTDELFPRSRSTVAPGAVHVPDWLPPDRQRELVEACRAWARPPAGLRTVRTPGGGAMSARQVCLGLHWYPYGYARTAVDGDGAPVKPFPARLGELAREAVREAYGEPGHPAARDPYDPYHPDGGRDRRRPDPYDPYSHDPYDPDGRRDRRPPDPYDPYDPYSSRIPGGPQTPYGPQAPYDPDAPYDIALINFYGPGARMGMHRDGDEHSDAPVVSLSLGDSCVFRFATEQRPDGPDSPDGTRDPRRPYRDVELRSGDLFVFGGPARHLPHGVPRVHPGSGPPGLGLKGRLNITLRVSGIR